MTIFSYLTEKNQKKKKTPCYSALLVGLLFQLRDKVLAKQPLCLATRTANTHQIQLVLNHTARRPDVPACLPTFTRWTNNSNDRVNQSSATALLTRDFSFWTVLTFGFS